MPWIRDNWKRGERLSARWANAVAAWFNRLTFDGPLGQERTAASWMLKHLTPDTGVTADSGCEIIGQWDAVGEVPYEGLEAAASDTEAIGSQETKPIRLYAMTRVAYYHAGDKKLYGYVRSLTFDPYGHLTHISAETRVEIDVPGAC